MGQTPGMSGGQLGMSLLRSGLAGLGQGLTNYSNPQKGFDFSKLAQAGQVNRPALGAGVTPNYKRLQGIDQQWGGFGGGDSYT